MGEVPMMHRIKSHLPVALVAAAAEVVTGLIRRRFSSSRHLRCTRTTGTASLSTSAVGRRMSASSTSCAFRSRTRFLRMAPGISDRWCTNRHRSRRLATRSCQPSPSLHRSSTRGSQVPPLQRHSVGWFFTIFLSRSIFFY